ncbi:hypothetical protein FHR34_007255 [Kitasatospora kifunensis]|uniref:Uncharacterized protein n=1 Tax=Kitasatospora kifunensis TaxID=58351 RepID=A0A7W7RA96_KITKI|nr:hypothetical protein [Kitasatospora kifunensis]
MPFVGAGQPLVDSAWNLGCHYAEPTKEPSFVAGVKRLQQTESDKALCRRPRRHRPAGPAGGGGFVIARSARRSCPTPHHPLRPQCRVRPEAVSRPGADGRLLSRAPNARRHAPQHPRGRLVPQRRCNRGRVGWSEPQLGLPISGCGPDRAAPGGSCPTAPGAGAASEGAARGRRVERGNGTRAVVRGSGADVGPMATVSTAIGGERGRGSGRSAPFNVSCPPCAQESGRGPREEDRGRLPRPCRATFTMKELGVRES